MYINIYKVSLVIEIKVYYNFDLFQGNTWQCSEADSWFYAQGSVLAVFGVVLWIRIGINSM